MWRQPLAPKPNVVPPPSGAASPNTLGRERREHKDSPKKRLHHQQTEQTKCPWLHCQDVGPLQQSEGPHSHDKCHSSECKLSKPIPNQTPMHLGRCHSCASQRHPDTMHNNITLSEVPLLPRLMYGVGFQFPKQSHATLQYAQNGATVVPVNDTRTQCTTLLPPIKERSGRRKRLSAETKDSVQIRHSVTISEALLKEV